jgi:hypothetical protein
MRVVLLLLVMICSTHAQTLPSAPARTLIFGQLPPAAACPPPSDATCLTRDQVQALGVIRGRANEGGDGMDIIADLTAYADATTDAERPHMKFWLDHFKAEIVRLKIQNYPKTTYHVLRGIAHAGCRLPPVLREPIFFQCRMLRGAEVPLM